MCPPPPRPGRQAWGWDLEATVTGQSNAGAAIKVMHGMVSSRLAHRLGKVIDCICSDHTDCPFH